MGERIDFLVGPWRDWRLPKLYQCEVCSKRLNRRQVVERVEVQYGRTEFGVGGGGIIASYCVQHVPDAPKPREGK